MPTVKTAAQHEERRHLDYLTKPKVQRTETLLGGNFEIEREREKGNLHLHMKKKEGKQMKIADENIKFTGVPKLRAACLGEATPTKETEKDMEEEVEEAREAERFDFTMNDVFYKHNIRLDKYGERLTAYSAAVGRIVSRDGMQFDA